MLWIIGLGIHGYMGISINALEILKKCDKVYIERFTSSLPDKDLEGLNSLIRRNSNEALIPVQRWFVEDGREIIEQSHHKDVALLTYGDPLVATTFTELHTRAVKRSINVKIIHAASGITSLIGESGLHIYKFGRTVTMMSGFQSYITVYSTILDNLLAGNHTLILTEYTNNNDESFYLDPKYFFERMLEAEEDVKYGAFSQKTFVIVASRIGTEQQRIESGSVQSLITKDYGRGPHSIIVPASLHFTEIDAVKTLTISSDEPIDNAAKVHKLPVTMMAKYAPQAKKAVHQMRFIVGKENNVSIRRVSDEILDNAECYIDDAERFLRQEKFELAILSIGYAEGLIDALHIQNGRSYRFHEK